MLEEAGIRMKEKKMVCCKKSYNCTEEKAFLFTYKVKSSKTASKDERNLLLN
jgi:hypothetical protein